MHIGTDGSSLDSKTEAVFFSSASHPIKSHNLSPVYVTDIGYITYCNKFKYLGLYITQDLRNTYAVKNHILQATKALGAMMPNVFQNLHL
eukprot:8820465-Ditylum_brightwellii.AAC.1